MWSSRGAINSRAVHASSKLAPPAVQTAQKPCRLFARRTHASILPPMDLAIPTTAPMRHIGGLRPHSRAPLAAPPLRPPLRRRQSPARCPSSGAASVPAPDSGSSSSSNGAGSAPGSNGAGPAGEVQQAGQQPQRGFFGWLQAQRQRSAELRQKLASLGLAAVLSYGECWCSPAAQRSAACWRGCSLS